MGFSLAEGLGEQSASKAASGGGSCRMSNSAIGKYCLSVKGERELAAMVCRRGQRGTYEDKLGYHMLQ